MHTAPKSQAPRALLGDWVHKISPFSQTVVRKGAYGLLCVGVWEWDEGIAAALAPRLAEGGHRLLSGRHPGELAVSPLDLLVISPGARGWAGAGAVKCTAVLLPGTAGPRARVLQAHCAVSYGTSPRDTLTLSSLEGGQICLALQRELVTLTGQVVEQQELVLPFPRDAAPLPFLATAGALLLLDLPPNS